MPAMESRSPDDSLGNDRRALTSPHLGLAEQQLPWVCGMSIRASVRMSIYALVRTSSSNFAAAPFALTSSQTRWSEPLIAEASEVPVCPQAGRRRARVSRSDANAQMRSDRTMTRCRASLETSSSRRMMEAAGLRPIAGRSRTAARGGVRGAVARGSMHLQQSRCTKRRC